MIKLWGVMLILFCCIPNAYADTGASIGFIQTLKGEATILRDGKSLAAATGGEVFRGDLIQTAKGSAIGVVLEDDTTLSMGPESEGVLKACDFVPTEGRFSLVVRMIKGTFAYISGVIAKLAPEAVRLEIPDGTIAVRGTKLLIDVRE